MIAALLASSDGGPAWLLILGPAGAGGLYYGLWQYYRNTGKSHSFEKETRIALVKPVTGRDGKVDEVKGTKKTKIDGANQADHRQRVQRV
ncbi:MAG: hypothetical protein U0Q03_24340 [Acidimicrobiales bacterium]